MHVVFVLSKYPFFFIVVTVNAPNVDESLTIPITITKVHYHIYIHKLHIHSLYTCLNVLI